MSVIQCTTFLTMLKCCKQFCFHSKRKKEDPPLTYTSYTVHIKGGTPFLKEVFAAEIKYKISQQPTTCAKVYFCLKQTSNKQWVNALTGAVTSKWLLSVKGEDIIRNKLKLSHLKEIKFI